MKVSLLNLNRLYEQNRPEYEEAIQRVVNRSAFIGGEELSAFEEAFAKWVSPEFSFVGCGNGTDAITLAATSLKLSPGSEVIVPAFTYVATVEGLMHAGLKVKLIDVEPGTWLMDPHLLSSAVTSKTRLIAPVHIYGQMARMDEIRSIADQVGAHVLEDASQAHGATWKGHPIGYYGDVATFSFYPGKNLGAFGDAGGVLSRNPERVRHTRLLGNHGGLEKYQHLEVGYNSRLDNLQAAILGVKLPKLSEWNARRRQVAQAYLEGLLGIAGLELPVTHAKALPVYHLFVVLVEDRLGFMKHLKERGIDSGIHYPLPIHKLPAFANETFASEKFPQAERLAAHCVSLPMDPTLEDGEVDHVLSSVRSYFGKN